MLVVHPKDVARRASRCFAMTSGYFSAVRKIVITGPESSGKTTLAGALAAHYGTPWVQEAARSYLEGRAGFGVDHGYVEADLLDIARLQLQQEDAHATDAGTGAPRALFCDTDLITIRIWGEEKFGRSDPWIVRQTEERPYDLWLLCTPEMPWEPDPLRENPYDRDRLFAVYERTLRRLRKPYAVMVGDREARLQAAVEAIARLDR
jgi:NadR type nicotinamide-nucleotide adenylyltransferase